MKIQKQKQKKSKSKSKTKVMYIHPFIYIYIYIFMILRFQRGSIHYLLLSAIQTGKNIGMQTLESALAELYNRDVISLEDAMSRSSKVDELKNLVGAALKA